MEKDFRFEWNGSHSAVVRNLGFGKELQRDTAEILYYTSFPYMPYVSGDLSTNVHIQALNDRANIVHSVKYAPIQYEGMTYNPKSGRYIPISNRYLGIHPLATSEWYDVAWLYHKDEITKKVSDARLQYRSFNYG